MSTIKYDRDLSLPIMQSHGLLNVTTIYAESASIGLLLPGACALLEMESHGRNFYGHDTGGTLAGFPGQVNKENFAVFWWLVNDQRQQSNGVGPCQITSRGLLQQMMDQSLDPWDLADNMHFGFQLMKQYHDDAKRALDPHPWVTAGTRYNGSENYGRDLAAGVRKWHAILDSARLS